MIETPAPEHTHSVRRGRTAHTLLLVLLGFSAMAAAIALPGAAAARPLSPGARAAHLYTVAQRDFVNRDVPAGLAALDRAVTLAPRNTNVLALRAFWASQQLDFVDLNDSLDRLGAVNPGERIAVHNAIDAVNAAAVLTPDPFPTVQGPHTAIVVLGYGLLPDGSMRPELVSRLRAALWQASVSPLSPIVTTGGNPHHGITEGQAMAAWLIGHGVPAGRIFPETRADSTVQNALFSARIIHSIGAANAVVVTSANHVRRGAADLSIAGVPVVGTTVAADQLLGELIPPTPAQRWGMYVDATKVFGLPPSM